LVGELTQPAAPSGHREHHQTSDASAQHKDNQGREPETLWQKIASEPVAFTTLCLTAVTAILAVSTVGLWIVTARGGQRQSLDMQKSISIAERALFDVERALIVGETVGVSQLVRSGRVIAYRMNMMFINTGRTPAKRVRSNGNVAVFDGENVPDGFRYPDRQAAPRSSGVLGPGIRTPIPLDIAIQDIVGIMGKSRVGIYLWMDRIQ
jgi:hypothetical protein